MKKIIFGITSLDLGGAERVLVDICNNICNKFDITILTLYPEGKFEQELNKKVQVKSIFNKKYDNLSFVEKKLISLKLLNKHTRTKLYNKYINNNYDVEIAFLEGPITWIFSTKSNARKIAWVHNDIEDVFGKGKLSSLKQKLNKESYNYFDKLIFVSNDNKKKFTKFFKDNKVKKEVINNYINIDLILEKSNKFEVNEIDNKKISFVQVSRLVEQKAVDRLITVHKKLIDDGFNHNIYIVGEGPLKEVLQNKINELKINDTFILLGGKSNPYPYIKKCDYFMLTSYYEGYPMVLLEAKALNKYILITDSAARETIIDYENSQIFKNSEEGIYNGIKNIIEKKPKVKKSKLNSNEEILTQIIKVIEG